MDNNLDDFLYNLIVKWEKYKEKYTNDAQFQNLEGSYADEVNEELDKHDWILIGAKTNGEKKHPLEIAKNWLADRSKENDPYKKFIDCHSILKRLNDYFSTQRCRLISTKKRTLVIGRRAWCDQNTGTDSNTFPNIRRIKIPEGSWFEGNQVNLSFNVLPSSRISENNHSYFQVRVGLCCFSGNIKTFFCGTKKLPDGKYGFRAKEIYWENKGRSGNTQNEYKNELEQAINWAVENDINILLMPELCLDEVGRNFLEEKIKKTPNTKLCLVVPGSYHLSDNNNHLRNVAPIWLVIDKAINEIAAYRKHMPFEIEIEKLRGDPTVSKVVTAADNESCKEAREDIDAPFNEPVFLSTPIGVLGFAICRDILDLGHKVIPSWWDIADHVFIISMNAQKDERFIAAGKSLYDRKCSVFYVNAGQAIKDTEEAAFWFVPEIKADKRKIEKEYAKIRMAQPCRRCVAYLKTSKNFSYFVESTHCQIDLPEDGFLTTSTLFFPRII